MAKPRKKGATPKTGGKVKFALQPAKSPNTPKTMKIAPTGIVKTMQIFSNIVIGIPFQIEVAGSPRSSTHVVRHVIRPRS